MSIRPILLWPDPRLSQHCAPVPEGADMSALVRDLFETMYDAPGRGLAAPQIGVLDRVFVMDTGWKEGRPSPRVCINPVIEGASDAKVESPEGCLSIPGVIALVQRHRSVVLRYTDESGQRVAARLEGFEALCAQHELDHLDGLVHFDRLEPAARAALLAEYEALA